MGRLSQSDVLLAVAAASTNGPADGYQVMEVLVDERGSSVATDHLLTRLLRLETAGLIAVERSDKHRFGLTRAGESEVSRIGGGEVVPTGLLMVDLVGFVAFTERHGDAEAHRTSCALADLARAELEEVGGRVVKTTGDGMLGAAPPQADLVGVARRIASGMWQTDGSPWPLRGSAHVGTPIAHRRDLFGRDVNLLARLCDAAERDELVVTVDEPGGRAQHLAVRGFDDDILIERVALR